MPSLLIVILINTENIQVGCRLFLIYDTTHLQLEQQQSNCIISKPWRVYCKLGMICKFLALSCNDIHAFCAKFIRHSKSPQSYSYKLPLNILRKIEYGFPITIICLEITNDLFIVIYSHST